MNFVQKQKLRCQAQWLGRVDYQQAWDLQNQVADEIGQGKRPPLLMLLEHPHTYTIGRRGDGSNLLWDEETLTKKGIAVYWVDRGGDITYHGPGQLVGYPILPLASPGWQGDRLPQQDYVGYVRRLEETLLLALKTIGIDGFTVEGKTGIWYMPASDKAEIPSEVKPVKLASIGVKVDARGISRHGFALNIQTDKTYWQGIIPCGLEGVEMASVADFLPSPPQVTEVAFLVAQAFGAVFDFEMEIQSVSQK